jgi:hypothetical protein
MTAVVLTRLEVLALRPCSEQKIPIYGRRKFMNARQAFEAGVSIRDLCWVASKVGRKRELVMFALKCAQSTAHLNSNPRVQATLDATQAWIDNPSEQTRRAAYAAAAYADAAYAAAAAADAAYAAAAYADAAYAAAAAADAAYAAAAYAAADAAAYAAADAAAAAAYAAADAAYAAARQSEIAKQKEWFCEIFGC